MQPNNQNAPSSYSPNQFAPNPYAQQVPIVPVEIPETRSLSTGMIVSFVITLVLLLGSVGFGIWAFMSRQDYKLHTDQKIAVAVEKAENQVSLAKDAEFAEEAKNPYKEYVGPTTFGAISITYPKTWSSLVDETNKTTPVDGYFHPNFIPGIDSGTAFALRLRVVSKPYSTLLATFSSAAKKGEVKISPYSAPKVPSVIGSRVDGKINDTSKDGSMILLPLRDKTIEISTWSSDFVKDFDSIVLANLTFEP